MKKRAFFILYLLSYVAAYAQDKSFMDGLPYYIENIGVFDLGQNIDRSWYIPESNISFTDVGNSSMRRTPAGSLGLRVSGATASMREAPSQQDISSPRKVICRNGCLA